MPWKECNHMDERLRFVARLLDGDKMAVVCREFGISRKTGYKIFNRYKDVGLRGLEDQDKAPFRHPNKLPFQVEKAGSCWATSTTAIRSPSRITGRVTCWPVKASIQPRRVALFLCLNGRSGSLACRRLFAPTMVCHLLRPTPCSVSADYRYGGYDLALESSVSNRAIPNRTAATSACT